jgi:hypothetical protein
LHVRHRQTSAWTIRILMTLRTKTGNAIINSWIVSHLIFPLEDFIFFSHGTSPIASFVRVESNEFKHSALSIQNGTHPSPPINPVLDTVDEFESEVQDVVLGFETRLRRIRRTGERAFSGADSSTDGDEEEKVIDVQETSKPEDVSVLPVPTDDAQSPAIPNTPQVVIGRSKEEVLEAFERFEEQESPAAKPGDSERVDRSLGEDLPSEAVHHTEL